jgi:Ca2+-binding RTX toxin-like protein
MTPTRTTALLLVAIAACAVGAHRADAACASFPCTKIKVAISGTTLRITDVSDGDPVEGFASNFVYLKAKRDEGTVYVSEIASGVGFPGSVIAGKGCVAGSFAEETAGGNPEDAWHSDLLPTWHAKCPLAGVARIDVNVGRGDDFVNVVLSPIPVKVTGGAGDDVLEVWSCQYSTSQDPPPPYFSTTQLIGGLGSDYLYGGLGADRISGQGGDDWLEGSCGEDRLLAGGGFDYILSDDTQSTCEAACAPQRDIVSCGGSADELVADPSDVYVARQCESVSQ